MIALVAQRASQINRAWIWLAFSDDKLTSQCSRHPEHESNGLSMLVPISH